MGRGRGNSKKVLGIFKRREQSEQEIMFSDYLKALDKHLQSRDHYLGISDFLKPYDQDLLGSEEVSELNAFLANRSVSDDIEAPNIIPPDLNEKEQIKYAQDALKKHLETIEKYYDTLSPYHLWAHNTLTAAGYKRGMRVLKEEKYHTLDLYHRNREQLESYPIEWAEGNKEVEALLQEGIDKEYLLEQLAKPFEAEDTHEETKAYRAIEEAYPEFKAKEIVEYYLNARMEARFKGLKEQFEAVKSTYDRGTQEDLLVAYSAVPGRKGYRGLREDLRLLRLSRAYRADMNKPNISPETKKLLQDQYDMWMRGNSNHLLVLQRYLGLSEDKVYNDFNKFVWEKR